MSEPVDPFERLRELNPVQPDFVRTEAESEEAKRNLEEILEGRRQTRRRRPTAAQVGRLSRRTYVLILIPVAGAIAAGAWALTLGTASKHLAVGCYASAKPEARTVVVPNRAGSPLHACDFVWRRGDFGSTVVPPLQACVLPSGAIGVFPGSATATCGRLRLKPLNQSSSPSRGAGVFAVKLKNTLVAAFLAKRCLNRTDAVSTVQAAIKRFGADGWSVQLGGAFNHQRPCASLAFDEPHKRVILVPMPRQP